MRFGLIDVISELFRCNMISPKGKFIREGKRIRHDKYGMGSYVLAFREDADSVKDVEITEVDIDNFIRAKGAIFPRSRPCSVLLILTCPWWIMCMWQAESEAGSI